MSSTEKREKWMSWCIEGARIFSTCAKKQYMAIILDNQDRVLGLGYNGVPSGMVHCKDGGCPRYIDNTASGTNYDNCYSCHAEQNALLNSDSSAIRRGGAKMIINGPPCFTCAKMIVNSGINFLYFLPDPSYEQFPEILKFMTGCGVRAVPIQYSMV